MPKERANKVTREIVEPGHFSKHNSEDLIDSFKGKIAVLDPEKSEIAEKLNIKKKGIFAIRLR